MGPRYPVKEVMRADPSTIPRAEARVLHSWTTRREKGLSMHATGADREKLTVWHDKVISRNITLVVSLFIHYGRTASCLDSPRGLFIICTICENRKHCVTF